MGDSRYYQKAAIEGGYVNNMTIDYKRIDVLLDLLRESLPKGSLFTHHIDSISLAVKQSNLTTEDYANVSKKAILMWNGGQRLAAIKRIRPDFPHLSLLDIKYLLESHPMTSR